MAQRSIDETGGYTDIYGLSGGKNSIYSDENKNRVTANGLRNGVSAYSQTGGNQNFSLRNQVNRTLTDILGYVDNRYGNPSNGVNGANGAVGYSPNYYSMLANYYKQQNDEAQKSALAAIEERLKTNIDMYNQQLPNVDNAYQKLIDQNEVNRYRNQASIREALANRGQLDTGLGRQEMLNASATNSRNLNNIMLEREGARNDIRNAISQLKADAESDKANVKATYTQALKDWVSKQ